MNTKYNYCQERIDVLNLDSPLFLSHPDILVLDDDLQIREMLSSLAYKKGLLPVTFASGGEVFKYIEHTSYFPSLFIIDMKLGTRGETLSRFESEAPANLFRYLCKRGSVDEFYFHTGSYSAFDKTVVEGLKKDLGKNVSCLFDSKESYELPEHLIVKPDIQRILHLFDRVRKEKDMTCPYYSV